MADLVLIGGNPLMDIANTRKIIAVIADGTLFDQSRRRALAADAAASEVNKLKNDAPRGRLFLNCLASGVFLPAGPLAMHRYPGCQGIDRSL